MAQTTYLTRAGDGLVSHCKCPVAPITAPPQADCPWCGCGWLFTCIYCRKAFAFAQSVVLPYSMEDLAVMDLQSMYGVRPDRKQIDAWVRLMRNLLGDDLPPGHRWVYFDGSLLPADVNDSFEVEGIFAKHNLPWIPQIQALHDPAVVSRCLSNAAYWRANAVRA